MLGAVAIAGGDPLTPNPLTSVSRPRSFLLLELGAAVPAPKTWGKHRVAPVSHGTHVPRCGDTLSHACAVLRACGWWSAYTPSSPNPTRKVRAHGGAWRPARTGLLGGSSIRAGACPPGRPNPPTPSWPWGWGVINYQALGLMLPTPSGGWRGCPVDFICTQWK